MQTETVIGKIKGLPIILVVLFSIFSSFRKDVSNSLEPVGAYEFSSVDDGVEFTADITIEGTPGNYKGTIKRRDRDFIIHFTDLGINENRMIIVADVRNQVLVLRLIFSGNSFDGQWSLGSEGNELKGIKKDS